MTGSETEIRRVINYIRSCRNAGIDVTITIDKSRSHFILNALEEIWLYRAIGTVAECKEAVKKPKAPDIEGDGYTDGQLVYDTWICPCCGEHYEIDYDDYDYCPKCGQYIEKIWSD